MTGLSEAQTARMMHHAGNVAAEGDAGGRVRGSVRDTGRCFLPRCPTDNSSLRNVLKGRSESGNAREACGLSSPCESINNYMRMFTWSLIHTPAVVEVRFGIHSPSGCDCSVDQVSVSAPRRDGLVQITVAFPVLYLLQYGKLRPDETLNKRKTKAVLFFVFKDN